MARRSSFGRTMNAIGRASARAIREVEAAQRAQVRELERQQREAIRLEKDGLRLRAAADKAAQKRYLELREQESQQLNADVAARLEALAGVLTATLGMDDHIDLKTLKRNEAFPEFKPPAHLTEVADAPEPEVVKPLGTLQALIPGAKAKHQREIEAAAARHTAAYEVYGADVRNRFETLSRLRHEYTEARADHINNVRQHNQDIEMFIASYATGVPTAVSDYCSMVLEQSVYPDGFPHDYRVAYVPDPKELVVEMYLPEPSVVPDVLEFKYVKTRDAIDEKPRKSAEIKAVYQDIIASITLRTIHELLEADRAGHIQVIVFNGVLETVDTATGNDIRKCLVSVRTTRDTFTQLNLNRVADKQACLRNLGAQVSSRPDEAVAVKPVLEFDMVDRRYVDQADLLDGIESRPNLMELSPTEFEQIVANLFSRMGLETKLTRSSRDGGVDAVAYDPRPVLGGKVVIQAKRYRHVVGVSAVRDLYGTMMNEGASKGIIVTTSNYGPDAYTFVKDKPLELIDGGGLIYLLEQVGVQARIVMPSE
jgi:restriction system protein